MRIEKQIGTYILLISLLSPLLLFSQQTAKINLIKADNWKYDARFGNAQRIIGDVVFKHDSTYLYCDSAYLYEETNTLKAFSNVRIKASDTLNIYGDQLNYDGNTRIAEIHYNVKLIDNRSTLTTEHMRYDRNTSTASYYSGGKIIDEENQLTSIRGYYYTNEKNFFFKDSVVLINPNYNIKSDTLLYNTKTKIAHFFGPTLITSDDNIIYCENGWYNTETDISQFRKNAYLQNKNQTLYGDSLFYNRVLGIGKAFNNVTLLDTVQKVLTKGHYAEYHEIEGYSIITDSALAIIIEKEDSLFLHADTIKATFDSARNAQKLFAYYKTKFYRHDLQGKSDSLVYDFNDSTITLYHKPVLWTKKNQLTADTIILKIKNNEIRMIFLRHSSFIISQDDTLCFNQIKGKFMTGHFRDNELKKITVNGNIETIYYEREEDGALIGINKCISSNLLIYMLENEIKTITYIKQVDGTTYPDKDLPLNERKLKNFDWKNRLRPKSKMDIFKWEEEE